VAQRPTEYKRFVPASLLPHGGFGDPGLKRPVWRVPQGLSVHKANLAKGQHSLACAIRDELSRRDVTEADFEADLGYNRHLLSRKLNGNEAMSATDLARLAHAMPSVMGALGDFD
jgi:hypothetical protein